MDQYLKHYGVARRSGRYPWGTSGWGNGQRNRDFLDYVGELRKEGLSDVDIARGLGMSTTELRERRSIANSERRAADATFALKLKDKGYSNVAIGERMGINESSVRSLLDPAKQERANITKATADMLKETVDKKGPIDIGIGVERYVGVSRTKLKTAISTLEDEGYKVYYLKTKQLGTNKETSIMALAPPGMSWADVNNRKADLGQLTGYTEDKGRTYNSVLGLKPIESINSNRLQIAYQSDKDGVIELRRGVDDISLGDAKYAQVRIGVDGTHFLKGMAVYSDNLPAGIDVRFNTNKGKDTPTLGEKDNTILKPMKDDPDNPFGATIKANGQRRALNIVNEEGDWVEWDNTISSQILSKQNPSLAKKQLGAAVENKQKEYDDIMQLTNPVVKKSLLESFADDCDASANHLKAAALPRQNWKVILPVPTLKENEIYAPTFKDGEKVVLFRHPHGGTFEVPELTVNNKHPAAKKMMNNATDAVGIHPKAAQRLSGADFDGDSVLVIPNNNGAIKTTAKLEALADFDPKISYRAYEGMPKPGTKGSGFNTQQQMGNISNLITDMTIKGADVDEISRAVRHSMVVIDAEKHNLNYKQSAIDNGIPALKIKYQGGANRGASTIISKADSELRVPERKEGADVGPISNKTGRPKRLYIDPRTGEKLYRETGATYVNKSGQLVKRTSTVTKMDATKDAHSLSSGTPMETIYANHANQMKSMANKARLSSIKIQSMKYSSSAAKTYAPEVASLDSKLNIALKNAPLERHAQLIANSVVATKMAANPGMDKADIKKIKNQALAEARTRTGAKKQAIEITPKEWEAIQSGAVSTNKLTQIIANSKPDVIKQLATPRTATVMTPAKVQRVKALLAAGRTPAEIAERLGVSTTSIRNLSNN